MAIVVFVTSELACADVKEESGSALLSEDTMFPEVPLDQDRAAVPAGLEGLLLFLTIAAAGNTAVMCGHHQV